MKSQRNRTFLAVVTVVVFCGDGAVASELYKQDFDSGGSLGFSQSKLNISANGLIVPGGVGGSNAYLWEFDGTNAGASTYFIAFGKMDAVPASDANPLGEGLVQKMSQILFSADVKVAGSLVPAPVTFTVRQIDSGYEQAHGIDANGDGNISWMARQILSRRSSRF